MQIDGSALERPAPPLNRLLRAGLEGGVDEVALVSAERLAGDHLHPHGLG